MGKGFLKWIREHYSKIISSIAFYPAIIAVGFLLLSWLMLNIDFSDWGRHIKSQLNWLSLKDANTARQIVSTIAGGIISLTVFSFSMVMIVLNQAASQMSNRILSSMIENRFQQIVLGFYMGAIVYALFLLSTIRDINSGIYVPALSIYLLIVFTVVDIFIFIYFLDYVTQTVKYETVINRVRKQTMNAMEKLFVGQESEWIESAYPVGLELPTQESGYLQGFDKHQVLQIAKEENVVISFPQPQGTFLIKGSLLLLVHGKEAINESCKKRLFLAVDFFKGQPIERTPEYGFHHLAEVAIKALSPGINDPATAVLSLHAMADLFAYRLHHSLPTVIKGDKDEVRITRNTTSFNELFENCIYPVWHYGKSDRYIQNAMMLILDQLKKLDVKERYQAVFNKLLNEVKSAIQQAGV